MINLTPGLNAAIIKGDMDLAISMLGIMYEHYRLKLTKCEMIEDTIAHRGHAWILQESNGWVALENAAIDQFIMADFFQYGGQLLDSIAYSVYSKLEDEPEYRNTASPDFIRFGVYDPKLNEYQYIGKGWYDGKWEYDNSGKTDKLPLGTDELCREVVVDYLSSVGIFLGFNGLDKYKPRMFVLNEGIKSDEEWAALIQEHYKEYYS